MVRTTDIGKRFVLVVDDDPVYLELAEAVLRRERPDWNLKFASDGETALQMMEQSSTPFSLLFCDINMPGRDGVELLADLARLVPGLSVVLISGSAAPIMRSTEVLATTQGLKVLGAFRKPLDFKVFAEFVRSMR